VSAAYAAQPCVIHQLLHVLRGAVNVCVCRRPCRLPRDSPAADDGPAEVPPGEARGAQGLLPAAQRHPGGALQEGCGEEHRFLVFIYLPLVNSSAIEGFPSSSIRKKHISTVAVGEYRCASCAFILCPLEHCTTVKALRITILIVLPNNQLIVFPNNQLIVFPNNQLIVYWHNITYH